MPDKLTLATLPRNDIEAAIALAKKLANAGKLSPDYITMIIQSQDDPAELLAAFEREGIEATD